MAPAPVLLRDPVDHWADVRPDAPAVVFGDRGYTWRQWRERVLRAAGALRDAGVGAGDRIAVLDLNHLATVELTLAASSLGAATVVVNFRLAPEQVRYILADSGPAILFHGADLAPLASAAGAAGLVPRLVVLDGYESLLAAAAPLDARDAGPDDVCLVLYTSGTTGRPKGAELTHRGVNAHSAASNSVFGVSEHDVSLVAMPMFHVGGSCYAQCGIHAGAKTVIVREPTAPALFGAVAAGATQAFLVPAILHGVLAAGEQAVAGLAPLRTIAYGASPMPLPMLRQALAAWPKVRFVQVYGMTEVSGVATMLTGDEHRDEAHPQRLLSAGRPLPGVEAKVVDPATLEDLPAGATGELWLRTAQAMRGYLNDPEATAQAKTPDGFVRTGDIGRIDADGYVYVVDRLKDMIITGGENVYSPEVENVLNACPGVQEGVVVGVPDERWGEAVKAFVVPAPGTGPSEAEVIGYCRERLAHYQCPSSVEFVAELPRNATGKVLKHALRAPYWSDAPRRI